MRLSITAGGWTPKNLACAAYGAAVALYALFSSPTPDAPGWVEGAVLAGLICAALASGAGYSAPVFSQAPAPPARDWRVPFAILLLWGYADGALAGVLRGNAPADMLRDAVGFSALAVPLVLHRLFAGKNSGLLLASLLGVGLAFALRFLLFPGLLAGMLDHDLLYLANSPLVAFAASWLLLIGCFGPAGRPIRSFLCVALALVPLLAMAGMMQRATLGLLALVWSGFWLVAFRREPRRAVFLGGCAVVLGLLFRDPLGGLLETLIGKTENLGWNARGPELAALFRAVSDTPAEAMFGAGFGSLFKSPAVGDLWVRFSHSLFSSLFWKTGWVGLFLGVWACGSLAAHAIRGLRGAPVLLASLLLALGPPLFLYGSYKSLCFGLLLLGLAALRMDSGHKEMLTKPTS